MWWLHVQIYFCTIKTNNTILVHLSFVCKIIFKIHLQVHNFNQLGLRDEHNKLKLNITIDLQQTMLPLRIHGNYCSELEVIMNKWHPLYSLNIDASRRKCISITFMSFLCARGPFLLCLTKFIIHIWIWYKTTVAIVMREEFQTILQSWSAVQFTSMLYSLVLEYLV